MILLKILGGFFVNDYVQFWWMREEFADQQQDWQTGASWDQPGADLLQDAASISGMLSAPLGEPPTDFDVRCVYDSRIINSYDFNFTATISGSSTAGWSAQFIVPVGYRAVPRKWAVQFDQLLTGPSGNSIATIQQNGGDLPNNTVCIGMGTDEPIETFFLCEEQTTFGIAGFNSNPPSNGGVFTGSVNVYGNLIPVSSLALPLAASNQILGVAQTGVGS